MKITSSIGLESEPIMLNRENVNRILALIYNNITIRLKTD